MVEIGRKRYKNRGKDRRTGQEKEEEVKTIFWIMVEIKKKEDEFWKYIENRAVLGIAKTVVVEKNLERIKIICERPRN